MRSFRGVVGFLVTCGCVLGVAHGLLPRTARRPAGALRRGPVGGRGVVAMEAMEAMEATTTSSCTGEKVVIVGATGYIGKSVVRESVRRGYPTVAVVRDAERAASEPKFQGSTVQVADVCDPSSLAKCPAFQPGQVDVVVSCLASRSGIKKDSYAIDYQATLNCMEAARAAGARHFVLLSAYCVAKPWLQFQFAKLKFEESLQAQTDLTYSIVRPTAFFKSVSGQLEVVQSGAPFVYFDLGGGKTATCNPISEADLAMAVMDTVADPAMKNKIWNLGGPDDGLSMVQQGKMLADITSQPERLLGVPIGLFDVIINGLQWVADTFQSEKFENAAELGRIGKYYAVEDMLTTEPSERYGTTTLREHYERIAKEGQEYDPYTTMFAGNKKA
mmetsp:Transcript_23723/g.69453  ORF Transcript_23723/g.69453 Transcript_23723/m.69453 type:complete len:388 (-) Transcript_23723:98-1261(-)